MINKLIDIFFSPRFLKFIVVGVINTVNHNIIYLAINDLVSPVIANTIAFLISMVISFFLNSYITFNTKPTWENFKLFPLTNIPNLIVQTIGIFVIIDILNIHKDYAALLTSIFSIPLTFIIMNVIFRRKTN